MPVAPTTESSAPRSTARAAAQMRTDIQGLRAIAVSAVVVFHLSGDWLPGGYVGVDVFFVISGFLITSHLLSRPPAGARDLATFWSRRIRRLLPASLLVLVTTLVATRVVAPETQWENTARQVRGAALYVINWLLARDSVDYLAAENAATPVQHYWSLAVEEQFYFVWPVLIFLCVWVAARTQRSKSSLIGSGLILVVLVSLVYSVTETASNPSAAYFITPTRMWELGIGGVTALFFPVQSGNPGRWRPLPPRFSAVLSWAGLCAIAITCVRYSGSTPFPGYQALLPVLGTAVVIAARPEHQPGGPGPLLALRPMQWLGDVSYAVYLWHWPLVVLVPYASGGRLGNLDRMVILLTTLVLAGLTKKYIEDPFRKPGWGVPLRKPYLLAAVGMAFVVGLTAVQLAEVRHQAAQAAEELRAASSSNDPCFGARALDRGKNCDPVPFDQVVPAPAEAAKDKSDAYDLQGKTDCWAYQPRFPDRTCEFGDTSSRINIVVTGNSHAGQWLPALQAIAADKHWKITTHLASQCAMSDVPQTFKTTAHSQACSRWVRRTARDIGRERPDLVVISNRLSVPALGKDLASSAGPYAAGYERILAGWEGAGLRVLVLRDTPAPGFSVPECVAEKGDDYAECGAAPDEWRSLDPSGAVVDKIASPRVAIADLNSHLCSPDRCGAVTGGVITYFDGSHMTATFAKTLAPYLEPAITRLMRR